MSYLKTLNDEQRAVVYETEGLKAVVAGAGSGKTRVIIAKVIHLIQDKGVLPSTIWICTFTKKAKEELVERLSKEVGASTAKKVKIGTLHSISFSIYKNGLMMVDGKSRYSLPKPLVNEGTALFQIFNFIRANEKKVHSKDGKDFLSTINVRRMYGGNLNNYKKMFPFNPEMSRSDKWCYNETVYEVWKFYEKWKAQKNVVDFGDMLVKCAEMLQNPKYDKYINSLQRSCNYLMIDEAQDNNAINYQIANVLSALNKNLTVVGDSRQAIYSFQGASLDNLHDFINMKKPTIYNLKTNYRSSATLVDNANTFIKGSAGIIGEPSVAFKPEGMPIKFCTSEDEVGEAQAVYSLVEDLVSGGYKYSDIAILYRVHSQSVMLESYFLGSDIPYVTFTENTFFDKREIKDVITYLKAFQDPNSLSVKDFKRIVGRPNRYISSKATRAIEDYCSYEDVTFWEALNDINNINIDYRNKKCFGELKGQIIAGINKYQCKTNVTDLIKFILNGIGYEQFVNGDASNDKTPDGDITMDFDAIIQLVNSFQTIDKFFDYVDKVKEQEAVRKGDVTGDYLQMMTFHASKGKEFPVVITLGNCTRIAPFHRNADREEEKRLMYVAITRPEKELYVSVVGNRLGRFKVQPSPFLHSFQATYNEDYSGRFYSFD